MTTYRANPSFLTEIKKYGTVNIESCFNCGNCTAVCPLSTESENFPRRMIRFAQLGMEDQLLSSKELWMCYYCGECTTTCPRQADPAEYMAAARRYAIANYDRTGLAKLLYTSNVFSIVFMIVMAVLLGGFMYTIHGPLAGDTLRLFEFIPAEVIHFLGLAGLAIVFLTGLWGAVNMVVQVGKASGFPKSIRMNWLGALWEAVGVQALGQKTYRDECEMYAEPQIWYLKKWYIHASIMWGFLGLLVATALDWGLDIVGLKPTGAFVPIWYPVRLLGTIAGLFLIYGSTMAIIRRIRKSDESTTHSFLSDWGFLILLWLTGVTGFVLELAIYLPSAPAWGYWMFLIHVVVAMELLLFAPFTKFAHAVYRTVALYLHALKPLP